MLSNKLQVLARVALQVVQVRAPVVPALALRVQERVPQELVQQPVQAQPPQVPLQPQPV